MKKTPNWQLWQSVFLPMIVVPNVLGVINPQKPVSARAALASLLFRLVFAGIGIVGYIVVLVLKKQWDAENPPVPVTDAPMSASSEAIVLPYRSTKETMWRCEKWSLLHRPEGLGPLIFLGVIAGLAIGFGAHDQWGVPLWGALLAGIPLGIVAWFGFTLALLIPMIQSRLAATGGVRNLELLVRREGLVSHRPEGVSEMPWSGIGGLQFHEGDIFFRTGGFAGFYLPRESFPEESGAKEFFQMLTALQSSRGARWPEFAPKPDYDLE